MQQDGDKHVITILLYFDKTKVATQMKNNVCLAERKIEIEKIVQFCEESIIQ